MTREEAIENFKEFIDHFQTQIKQVQAISDKAFDVERAERDIQTFEMAIKALEQNESAEEWYKLFVKKFESCEDAINREDAHNIKYDKVIDINGVEYVMLSEVQMRLRKLPSVAPKPTECDDAISRETVIDTLQYAWEANKDIQESIVEIKALPSVNPQPCEDGK